MAQPAEAQSPDRQSPRPYIPEEFKNVPGQNRGGNRTGDIRTPADNRSSKNRNATNKNADKEVAVRTAPNVTKRRQRRGNDHKPESFAEIKTTQSREQRRARGKQKKLQSAQKQKKKAALTLAASLGVAEAASRSAVYNQPRRPSVTLRSILTFRHIMSGGLAAGVIVGWWPFQIGIAVSSLTFLGVGAVAGGLTFGLGELGFETLAGLPGFAFAGFFGGFFAILTVNVVISLVVLLIAYIHLRMSGANPFGGWWSVSGWIKKLLFCIALLCCVIPFICLATWWVVFVRFNPE